MRYNLADEAERGKALDRLMSLMKLEKEVELLEVRKTRSLKQNAYLHLIMGYLGMEIGEPMDVVKEMYKMVNKNIYYRQHEVFGVKFKAPRSSADLDVNEMRMSIDNFREWSDKNGYPLPLATDNEWLRSIENKMEESGYNNRSEKV
jgi:hypothetical protein